MVVTLLIGEDLVAVNPSPDRLGFKKLREEQTGESIGPHGVDTISETQEGAASEGDIHFLPE